MADISLSMAVFCENFCCLCGEGCLKLAHKPSCEVEVILSFSTVCCGIVGKCVEYKGANSLLSASFFAPLCNGELGLSKISQHYNQ